MCGKYFHKKKWGGGVKIIGNIYIIHGSMNTKCDLVMLELAHVL